MLQEQLTTLTEGLYYISESDYPFEILHTELSGSSPEDLLNAYLAAQCIENPIIEKRTLADFFHNAVRIYEGMGEDEIAIASRFQQLLDFLAVQCAGNMEVFRVGNLPEKEVYLVGQSYEGENIIIRTKVVET